MADDTAQEDRTEDPTQRRLDEALQRGDVAKSQELSMFLSLGALTLSLMLLPLFGSGPRFALDLRAYLANAHAVPDGPLGLWVVGRHGALAALRAMALPIGAAVAAALLAGLIQHRPVFSTEAFAPKLSRLSPLAGLTRIAGRQALVQFAKGLAKITIVGILAGLLIWRERDRIAGLVGLDVGSTVAVTLGLCVKLLASVLGLHALVTVADVLYTRFSWLRRQRMTREEVKRETREQDGNPEIKAKIKQLRNQQLRKRMITAVPKATVIITNPTHFAVALRYEAGMGAPVCVFKGVDEVAFRIRALAEQHGIPVTENPPLARALHATVEIDEEIPVEHYRAVAEVIGFVLRLKRRAS